MKDESNIKCNEAQKMMSPYIDSMAEAAECESLKIHLQACAPCRRQLQSYISLRSLLAGSEQSRPPRDLLLETRVRLSQARSGGRGGWAARWVALETLLVNVLKPLAIPAVSGIALTVFSFSMMFGYIGLSFHAAAMDSSLAASEKSEKMEQPVRTTDRTLQAVSGNIGGDFPDPVSVQASVGVNGFVTDYTILGGAQSPAVKRWVTDMLYPAQFIPATMLGKPVNSTIILSFVNVRS